MRNLLLIFAFCFPLSALAQLEWRLEIAVVTTNTAAANALRGQIASVIKPGDISDARNRGLAVEARESTDSRTVVFATYILKNETTATNALAQVLALKNPLLAGTATLHCCPLDGSVQDWAGCRQDARAKFREVTW